MRLPWQAKNKEVTLPFPLARVTGLALVFHLTVERGIRLRTRSELDFDEFWRSAFFSAYVCGYPSMLDDEQILFSVQRSESTLFGLASTSVRKKLSACLTMQSEIVNGGEIAKEGWMLGADDGEKYFRSLLAHAEPDERSVSNLALAIRGMERFS